MKIRRLEVREAESLSDYMSAAVILDNTFGHLTHNASYFPGLIPSCEYVILAVEVYETAAQKSESVVGVYLLRKNDLRVNPRSVMASRRAAKYEDLRGIEGVALAVDRRHRGRGAGRMLREYSLTMDFDYIWGMQFKSLNNLQNWTKSGRELIYETGDAKNGASCTARMMPPKREVLPSEPEGAWTTLGEA
jgi:hypothetical protein